MTQKVLNVVGARPNFVKIASIMDAMRGAGSSLHPVLVHTGQHYDANMSDAFFSDLEIPAPDVFLGVGSGSHAEQTAKVMTAFEGVCTRERPDVVLVVGDVNSTLACSLVAAKLCIPVAHVEAGLRSFDRTMPEEINRLVTDAVSDFLFVSEKSGMDNLAAEGKDPSKVHFVGNVMIDTLFKFRKKAGASPIPSRLNAASKGFGLVTLHRPSNVDRREVLEPILKALSGIASGLPLFFSVHPRTRARIEEWKLGGLFSPLPAAQGGLYWLDPLGYLDFLCLMDRARLVLTDSGGIQEETTALGVPCLTLRDNTERPVTITDGTNRLVGSNPAAIRGGLDEMMRDGAGPGRVPPLWDGRTAGRIVEILKRGFLS